MEFGHPQMLWALLALPAVALGLAWEGRRARVALAELTGLAMRDRLAPGYSWRRHLLKGALKVTALALVIVALAWPRFGSQLVKVEREGIDLVIALDTSLSMLAEDMLPSRLERAKQEIVDLIKGLNGDRVGLVAFAGDAATLCPLTVDYDAALMFTRAVDVFVISEPGTAVEKAIDASAALFDDSQKRDRALILVTDGENHEGDPLKAALAAGERGIKIYTIGIGNPSGELIPDRGTDGSVAGYKKDQQGETVLTRLDETTLQQIATAAGGKYLPATREGLELKVLYSEISGMDRKVIKGEFVERKKERFWMFLIGALACMLLDMLIGARASVRGAQRALLHTGATLFLFALVLPAGDVYARRVDSKKIREGNKSYAMSDYEKAHVLYQEALGDTTRLPNDPQGAFYNQGNSVYMQGDYQRAIEMYQRSYSEDSTLTGRMLYNRGNAFLKNGNLGEAAQSYVQALQFMPDDADARHNLEVVLRLMKEQQQQQEQNQQGDEGDQEQQEQEQQQQGEQQRDGEQEGEQQDPRPGDQEQQEQEGQQDRPEQENQREQGDSTQTQEQQQRPDSSAVQRPELSPEELMGLSKEDAMRILQALEEQENQLQKERRQAAFRRMKRSGKDW